MLNGKNNYDDSRQILKKLFKAPNYICSNSLYLIIKNFKKLFLMSLIIGFI